MSVDEKIVLRFRAIGRGNNFGLFIAPENFGQQFESLSHWIAHPIMITAALMPAIPTRRTSKLAVTVSRFIASLPIIEPET